MALFKLRGVCSFLLFCISVLFLDVTAKSAEVFSPQSFLAGGKPVVTSAININGSNYMKVAEFARNNDISIVYDTASDKVTFDKTKPYSGIQTVQGKITTLALVVLGEKEDQDPSEIDNTWDYNGYQGRTIAFTTDRSDNVTKIGGFYYMLLTSLAYEADIELSYDVAANAVLMNKSHGNSWANVRIVANGAAVNPIVATVGYDFLNYGSWGSGASADYYTGTPGVLKDGWIIEARYESYPYGNIYRTVDYQTSVDFPKDSGGTPITEIGFGSTSVTFGLYFKDRSVNDLNAPDEIPDVFKTYTDEYLMPWANRGEYLNALSKLLISDWGVEVQSDTTENRAALAKLFRVIINGEPITGTLTRKPGSTAAWGWEYYIYHFDKAYQIGDIKSIRVELGV